MISENEGDVMGGINSTRWPLGYRRKARVEECFVLNLEQLVSRMRRDKVAVTSTWTSSMTGEVLFEITTVPRVGEAGPVLDLSFTARGREVEQTVALVLLPVLGGRTIRVLGRCPICLRSRVQKLYLPWGGDLFGCRQGCYDLAYESSQESNQSVRALRRDPERCVALLRRMPTTSLGITRLNNAMKALPYPLNRFKGAGRVPSGRWATYYLKQALEDGSLDEFLSQP